VSNTGVKALQTPVIDYRLTYPGRDGEEDVSAYDALRTSPLLKGPFKSLNRYNTTRTSIRSSRITSVGEFLGDIANSKTALEEAASYAERYRNSTTAPPLEKEKISGLIEVLHHQDRNSKLLAELKSIATKFGMYVPQFRGGHRRRRTSKHIKVRK
jgi:hypothetical protein